jgi:predicted ATPase
LPLLSHGPRDLPARQQTLRAAIGWSYDLLTPTEQARFRRLGVFVGGFSLDAVERVLDGQPGLDPLEGIGSLVDKSLVFVQLIDAAMPWYGMLGTIREFALEKLDASGETGALRRRHAELERDLAERGQARLLVSAERDGWLARFESDHMNVRAALGWTLGADGDLAVGVALAGALVLGEHGPTPGGPRLVRSPAGPMRRRR